VTLVEGRIEVLDRVDSPAGAADMPQPGTPKAASVRSTRAQMVAGQQISMSASGLSEVKPANVRQATAWLDGRLMFDKERLQDAVAEINRYSAVKLMVVDEALADLKVSGVFRTDRADSFLDAVKTSLPVQILPAADGARIIAPEDSPPADFVSY
jgi:transmembrane sensor